MEAAGESRVLPRAFVWRRLHSLAGLWMVLFLMEHLLTNSQAALWLGDNGQGFVRMVNWIHNLPYLQAIELFLLGVPFALHMVWGVRYALSAKPNSIRAHGGAKPFLPEYGRNRAYTWQRITSWVLLVALVLHVVKFRFIEYPQDAWMESSRFYFVQVHSDPGLYQLAPKLDLQLYSQAQLQQELTTATGERLKVLEGFHLAPGELVAEASDFGTATLLTVRDTFKNPIYVALYTLFVLAAVFHAFNGLWTFLITWGVILSRKSHGRMVHFCTGLMFLVGFMGLAAVWGSYYI